MPPKPTRRWDRGGYLRQNRGERGHIARKGGATGEGRNKSRDGPVHCYIVEQELPKIQAPEDRQKERASLLRLVRATFTVLFVTVGILAILDIDAGPDATYLGAVALVRGWGLVVAFAFILGASVIAVEVFAKRKRISTLFSIVLGLIVAMLATYALALVIDMLAKVYSIPEKSTLTFTAKVLIGITLAYLCISTIIQTQDDFRLVIPYVEFAKQIRGPRPMLLDSSALIDARIADLGDTGVIQQPLVIPHFVVAELQLLADSADKLKRARGRRGLDIVARLQRSPLDVSIDETPIPGKAVDQMLVELARRMTGIIVSADVGLNRVAGIQGVRVLNLNDVANSLKPALIPGEQISIKLIKAGEQPGQGVGYLEDGTMIVAEDGAGAIGEQVTLTVTSTLQTSAGRLLFGRIVPEGPSVRVDDHRQALPPGHDRAEAQAPAPGSDEEVAGEESSEGDGGPEATRINPPSGDKPRTPYPPKPPNKRVNPARNPRR